MNKAKKIYESFTYEHKTNLSDGLYHFTQYSFAYNSNKIEGSSLSQKQVQQIYETHTILAENSEPIRTDDIIETINHFHLFDYMLENMNETLNKKMILEMHKILKHGTSDEENPIYNVGGFKIKPNVIGAINVVHTSAPKDVEKDLDNLINSYNSKQKITIEDIIDFHYNFEKIHPLSDGNGRVGRMIMFKECLKNDIVPFIILNDYKSYYINGLKNYTDEKGYLVDTCLHAQDTYDSICSQLDIYK